MTIVEYNGYDDIVVQFNDKYKCYTQKCATLILGI